MLAVLTLTTLCAEIGADSGSLGNITVLED